MNLPSQNPEKGKRGRNDTPLAIACPSDTGLNEEHALNVPGVQLVNEFWICEGHSMGRD